MEVCYLKRPLIYTLKAQSKTKLSGNSWVGSELETAQSKRNSPNIHFQRECHEHTIVLCDIWSAFIWPPLWCRATFVMVVLTTLKCLRGLEDFWKACWPSSSLESNWWQMWWILGMFCSSFTVHMLWTLIGIWLWESEQSVCGQAQREELFLGQQRGIKCPLFLHVNDTQILSQNLCCSRMALGHVKQAPLNYCIKTSDKSVQTVTTISHRLKVHLQKMSEKKLATTHNHL